MEVLLIPPSELDLVADALAHSGRDLRHLQQLNLLLPGHQIAASLPWLLMHTPGLTVLGASMNGLPWFPSLANLKHLVLDFHAGQEGNICTALLGATALQTVYLSKPGRSALCVGALLLDQLPHLEVLVLRNILPTSLALPSSCVLHLLGFVDNPELSRLDMTTEVWADVVCNVRSIGVVLYGHDRDGLARILSDCVLRAPNLHSLAIEMKIFGKGSSLSKLDVQGFGHLKKLSIAGRSLHVQLPQTLGWEEVTFDASEELVLRFHDVSGFVLAVPRFEASFRTIRNTWLVDLCAALGRQGIVWGSQQETNGKSKFWFPVQHKSVCSCGACSDCLAALGKAVAQKLELDIPQINAAHAHFWEDVDANVLGDPDPDVRDTVHYPVVDDYSPTSPIYRPRHVHF